MEYKVISFYKYIEIENPLSLREEIYNKCKQLDIFGRILIGEEGINCAVFGKIKYIEEFKKFILNNKLFSDLTFREQENNFKTYHKLVVRVRKEIVHFGHKIDVNKMAQHISPKELKECLDKKENILLIDARNNYETAVGKFKNAKTLPIETFREFPYAINKLNLKNKEKVVLYCTGGIRCEKASAYLKQQGYENVYQLQGGIINYVNQFPDTYFEGSCFVFDDRITFKAGNNIIAECEICGNKCDDYINCHNLDCDKLFISCNSCQEKLKKHCSEKCMNAKRHRKEPEKSYTIIGFVSNLFKRKNIVETKLINGAIKINDKVYFRNRKNEEFCEEIKELRDANCTPIDNAKEGDIVTFPVKHGIKKNYKILLYN